MYFQNNISNQAIGSCTYIGTFNDWWSDWWSV